MRHAPLAEPWADSGTSTGRLMLAVLGGLADVERDLIRTRIVVRRAAFSPASAAKGRCRWAQLVDLVMGPTAMEPVPAAVTELATFAGWFRLCGHSPQIMAADDE